MNPQATVSPQVQAGAQIQPQATTVSPQGVAAQAPVQAPTPPVLQQAPTPVAAPAQVATPNFNTSGALNDIAAYYNIPRQTAAVAGAGQAMGNVAQANFEAQKAQNQIKIQNQQDSLDPTKYQFTRNADGTVDIFNSVGDKVNIGQYAALTGANPAEALQKAGATDEASQKFIAAYNNFQTYVQEKIAAENGDVQAQAEVADAIKSNPGLGSMELGQLQNQFMNSYGSYFGQPENKNQGLQGDITPTLTSENNPASTSAFSNPLYKSLLNGGSSYTQSPAAGGGTSSAFSNILGK